MKVMKYFAVASLALFAACNNEENPVAPESGNQPVDVVMSVALPGPGTRAAMGELQNTANDQDAGIRLKTACVLGGWGRHCPVEGIYKRY